MSQVYFCCYLLQILVIVTLCLAKRFGTDYFPNLCLWPNKFHSVIINLINDYGDKELFSIFISFCAEMVNYVVCIAYLYIRVIYHAVAVNC